MTPKTLQSRPMHHQPTKKRTAPKIESNAIQGQGGRLDYQSLSFATFAPASSASLLSIENYLRCYTFVSHLASQSFILSGRQQSTVICSSSIIIYCPQESINQRQLGIDTLILYHPTTPSIEPEELYRAFISKSIHS